MSDQEEYTKPDPVTEEMVRKLSAENRRLVDRFNRVSAKLALYKTVYGDIERREAQTKPRRSK